MNTIRRSTLTLGLSQTTVLNRASSSASRTWIQTLSSRSSPSSASASAQLDTNPKNSFSARPSNHLRQTTMNQEGCKPEGSSQLTSLDRIPSSYGNFDRVVEPFKVDSASIQVVKWKSRKTGLTVVWVEVDGPLVNGYFTVATEIFNDSGVPHTLEHLIFLGSEKYPFKGILDSLANRAFARGTNAWTANTHTAYTVTTAGYDGFLRLLPIYMDHVLYATITSEGFTTEVYHINAKGEDAGVVYSEMQGVENNSESLMELCQQRTLYPSTSAYRSETGGLMAALRVLTVEQSQPIDQDPRFNLELMIVTGKLDPAALLKVLQDEVEPSLVKHGQDKPPAGWERPFLETSSKGGATLDTSQTVQIEFPDKDESSGEAQITWVGPSTKDFLTQTALDVLGTYLSDSAVSPLSKKFIEIDCPLCTEISFISTDAEKILWTAAISCVPVEHLPTITEYFKKTLAEEADQIDMNRLKVVIEREALKTSNQMEVNAHDALTGLIISNFLYGESKDLVDGVANELARYKTLASWSVEQWSTLFKMWMVDRPSLSILAKPSAKLADKLDAETKRRLEETRQRYGPEGLKKLGEKLEHAQKVNDTPYPDKILSDFPTPSLSSIKWYDVEIARGDHALKTCLQDFIDKKDPTLLPYFLQLNHVDSNIISIHINLSPSNLPPELLPLIPIYLGSFFSLPIKRGNGCTLPYDQVVNQLDIETIEYEINVGSPISQTVDLYMKIEKSKYGIAIEWLRDLLWGSVFDIDRLRITTIKALQGIPSRKRDGSDVAEALYDQMLFSPTLSLGSSVNILRQEQTLPPILEELKAGGDNFVKELERLRSHLLDSASLRISVSGNIRDLKNPKKSWLDKFAKLDQTQMEKPLLAHQVLATEGSKPSGKVVVMTMPSIESTFAYHLAKGPQGYNHPEQASLTIAISVLNALESYLWKAIRGTGLAYGASIGLNLESGHVYLSIYRSPDSWKAFHEAGRVIKDLVDRKIKFDDLILESGKSSFAYSVAKNIATAHSAAYQAYANVALKDVSQNFTRELLEQAKDVKVDDVLKSIEKYLLPIFDPKTSSGVVTSSATKSQPITDALKQAGYDVELRQLTCSAIEEEEGGHSDDDGDESSGSELMKE